MNITFKVTNQIIVRTDQERIVRDSLNYLRAVFTFSEDWHGSITAVFQSKSGAFNVILDEKNTCLVPWEILKDEEFLVSVFCGNLITANVVRVLTIKSGYTLGSSSRIPTEDVFNQIMEKIDGLDAEAIPYDNTESGLEAENVQAAIDEIADGGSVVVPDITATATVDSTTGTPSVTVSKTGTEENPNFDFAFSGLKGENPTGAMLSSIYDSEGAVAEAGGIAEYVEDNTITNKYAGKNVVHMGDSIVQGYNIAEKSAQELGYNVTNLGFQATTISDGGNIIADSRYFSLINLAKALRDNDWSLQDANYHEEYWGDHLSVLKNLDWTKVDVLILSYGVNDILIDAIAGDAFARDDVSICGCLKTAISIFNSLNPNMEIVVTTPMYKYVDKTTTTMLYPHYKRLTLWEVRNAICMAVASCGVKIVDMWALSGINEYNRNLTLVDGLHPTPLGQDMWAKAFTKALPSGYCGDFSLEPPENARIDNIATNMIMDSELFMNHYKNNASYCHSGLKFLCTNGDISGSECIVAWAVYGNIPVGTRIHFSAACRSTNEQEHRLGVRFFDSQTAQDVLDRYAVVPSNYTSVGVDFVTTEAYTSKVVIFYLKNMTAFSESVALGRKFNATVTLPS